MHFLVSLFANQFLIKLTDLLFCLGLVVLETVGTWLFAGSAKGGGAPCAAGKRRGARAASKTYKEGVE